MTRLAAMSSEAACHSPRPSSDGDYSLVTPVTSQRTGNSDPMLNMMAAVLNTMLRMDAKMDEYPQKVAEKLDSMERFKKLEKPLAGIMQKVDQLPRKMPDTSTPDKLDGIMEKVEQMSQKMLDTSTPDKLDGIMEKVEQMSQKMLDTSTPDKLDGIMEKGRADVTEDA